MGHSCTAVARAHLALRGSPVPLVAPGAAMVITAGRLGGLGLAAGWCSACCGSLGRCLLRSLWNRALGRLWGALRPGQDWRHGACMSLSVCSEYRAGWERIEPMCGWRIGEAANPGPGGARRAKRVKMQKQALLQALSGAGSGALLSAFMPMLRTVVQELLQPVLSEGLESALGPGKGKGKGIESAAHPPWRRRGADPEPREGAGHEAEPGFGDKWRRQRRRDDGEGAASVEQRAAPKGKGKNSATEEQARLGLQVATKGKGKHADTEGSAGLAARPDASGKGEKAGGKGKGSGSPRCGCAFPYHSCSSVAA